MTFSPRIPSVQRFTTFGTLLTLLILSLGHAAETVQQDGPRDPVTIDVNAGKPLFRLSELMIGANIEDLHYQMTGGLSSQLIHGESFFEPTPAEIARYCKPLEGWTAHGGIWSLRDGLLSVVLSGTNSLRRGEVPAAADARNGGPGARLAMDAPELADASASVEILFPPDAAASAGMVLKTQRNEADEKWGWYSGITVELDPKGGNVSVKAATRTSKHQEIASGTWTPKVGEWVTLAVQGGWVFVNGSPACSFREPGGLSRGRLSLVAHGPASFRNLDITDPASSKSQRVSFRAEPLLTEPGDALSMRWMRIRTETATGSFAMEEKKGWHPGSRSQVITFQSGEGEWGIENAGLCRWGISLRKGLPYEGFLRICSKKPTDVWVSLRHRNGLPLHAAKKLRLSGSGAYEKIPFTLVPDADDKDARFSVTLKEPGSVIVGYVFLQPGSWGLFKGLPIRKDLAEAVIGQGIRVLRMNGGMIERPGYRWAGMQGPRDTRPPYDGFYDRWCSQGFGVIEFLQFCEGCGLTAVPGLNLDETPESFSDFVAYANSPKETPAGQRRTADGHPEPFHLKYLQVANESAFSAKYAAKFKAVAEAVWKIDPEITLVTTASVYRFKPGDAEETVRKRVAPILEVLRFAKERGGNVLIDAHSFEGGDPATADGEQTMGAVHLSRWITRLAPELGKVPVGLLEFNAGTFDYRRGIAHAVEMNTIHRNGDVVRAVGTPNLSQPWNVYQTDWKAVLWTQGNIYFTQDKVWFQTAYLVDRMINAHWAPQVLPCEVSGGGGGLVAFAGTSDDEKSLVLRVVNRTDAPVPGLIRPKGFVPRSDKVVVEELTGAPSDYNTLDDPEKIKPVVRSEEINWSKPRVFPPYSFTVLEWQKGS